MAAGTMLGRDRGAVTRQPGAPQPAPTLLFFVTEDWYFVSHRLPLAAAAARAGFDVCVVTRVRKSAETIRAAGVRVIPFENERDRLNPVAELLTLWRLIRVYRRERPLIVHHVAMKPVLYGSIAALLTTRPRVVNAIAGMGWLFTSTGGRARRLRAAVRWMLAHLLRRGIALVQNPDDARFVADLGVAQEQIRHVPGCGVDLVHFRPTTEPAGPPMVLFPARVLWTKGVREFVEAAQLLRVRGIAARFVIAGEPDSLNPAAVPMPEITRWVNSGSVEYLGWVQDMAAVLAQCHVVCLPSYREGLPKSLLEAAAAGKPIVTSDVPGCRDVVRHGENGLLVQARSAPAVADAVATLIGDPVLRQTLGQRGRQRAEEEFGSGRIIDQTIGIYRELLQ